MTLQRAAGILESIGAINVVLIIDASDSADGAWEEIRKLAEKVLDKLPADTRPTTIYFLGNPQAYNAEAFSRMVYNWRLENRRASLVTPIFEKLSISPSTKIVIIGSGEIFDLEDWRNTDYTKRLRLVSFHKSLQGDPPVAEELRPDEHELLSDLQNPVIRVEIIGESFMPYAWDNECYKFKFSKGHATLIAGAEQGQVLTNASLYVEYFALPGTNIYAIITFQNGRQETEMLKETTLKHPQQNHFVLSEQETAIFRQVIHKGNFTCPHCLRNHGSNVLRCEETKFFKLVYHSLEGRKGFCIFCEEGERIRVLWHKQPVLAIGNSKVAVLEGSEARIYQFDPQRRGWTATGVLQNYQQLDEGRYIIINI